MFIKRLIVEKNGIKDAFYSLKNFRLYNKPIKLELDN